MFRRWLGAAGLVFVASGSAHAFYFPDWPGAVRPPVRAILYEHSAGDPPSVRDPAALVPVETPKQDPNAVAEPGTLLLAGLGAGLVLLRKQCGISRSR